MRDILIMAIVCGGCVYALGRAWVGVVLWTWISVMNPHLQAYGFARSFPVAAMVAVSTMIGFIFAREKRNPFLNPAVAWLTMFMIWVCVGWPFSFYKEDSLEMLSKVLKIDFMILLTISLIITKDQIKWFIWTVAFSLGFYGLKGGLFTIMTGGSYRVWGPGGFIGGNNEVALAFVVVIPLIYYIYLQAPPAKVWLRRGLIASMLLTAAAALGSHSRGALLAIVAMAGVLWFRSQRKVMFGAGLVFAAIVSLAFLPQEWFARMQTIETYDKDESAMGRINAWAMAWNLANDRPLTGGGFMVYEPDIFQTYAPDPLDIHAAHSIYFQVLGEHGWAGLLIWLAIWWYTWRTASWLKTHGKEATGSAWCRDLGSMCQVSLVGFFVGGAFLSLAYFDLPYNLMVMVVTAKAWMLKEAKATDQRQVSRAQSELPA